MSPKSDSDVYPDVYQLSGRNRCGVAYLFNVYGIWSQDQITNWIMDGGLYVRLDWNARTRQLTVVYT